MKYPATNVIIQDVISRYDLKPGELTGPRRYQELVAARREVARRMTEAGSNLSEIARVLRRDRTTIINLLRREGWTA